MRHYVLNAKTTPRSLVSSKLNSGKLRRNWNLRRSRLELCKLSWRLPKRKWFVWRKNLVNGRSAILSY